MKIRHRVAAVASTVAVTAAMSLALANPASASTTRPNALHPDAIGAIVCSGDLCIQTDSCNSDETKVSIEEWADTSGFYGHFELEDPNGVDYNSPSNTNWNAGGKGHVFTVPLYLGDEYTGIAWRYTPSSAKYTNIGEVNFTVNNC